MKCHAMHMVIQVTRLLHKHSATMDTMETLINIGYQMNKLSSLIMAIIICPNQNVQILII